MFTRIAILLIVFILGGASYWLIAPLFITVEVQDELDPELQARLDAQRRVDAARDVSPAVPTATDQSDDEEPTTVEAQPADGTTSFGIQSRGPFPITGTPLHPALGTIELIESAEEKLVYYQDYEGTNGPDLHVYLATDLEATEFYDLGPAKGNRGNLIYGVPLDVDLSEYRYVLTWCKAFSELFDYAEIN